MFMDVVICFGFGLVVKYLFVCWWQKCQMSDSEKIEVGHVMKEPEFQDLKNKNITKWLVE